MATQRSGVGRFPGAPLRRDEIREKIEHEEAATGGFRRSGSESAVQCDHQPRHRLSAGPDGARYPWFLPAIP